MLTYFFFVIRQDCYSQTDFFTIKFQIIYFSMKTNTILSRYVCVVNVELYATHFIGAASRHATCDQSAA